jgi:cyclase
MLNSRVIPVLQILDGSLVKTVNFGRFCYVGDPLNSTKIFNELCADELVLLDISFSRDSERSQIDWDLVSALASECFMPLTYGGGVRSLEDAQKLIGLGVEKIVINSASHKNPGLVSEISHVIGSSSLVVSIDVRKSPDENRFWVWTEGGRIRTQYDLTTWAKICESNGAGEIFVTDIGREGTWSGVDLKLIEDISNSVSLPYIIHGGASSWNEVSDLISSNQQLAIGIGNLVCFQGSNRGVLINYPRKLSQIL